MNFMFIFVGMSFKVVGYWGCGLGWGGDQVEDDINNDDDDDDDDDHKDEAADDDGDDDDDYGDDDDDDDDDDADDDDDGDNDGTVSVIYVCHVSCGLLYATQIGRPNKQTQGHLFHPHLLSRMITSNEKVKSLGNLQLIYRPQKPVELDPLLYWVPPET